MGARDKRRTVTEPALIGRRSELETLERAVRRLSRDILTNYDYTVLDDRDGDEALAIAREQRGVIDLVVTDMVMPGLRGRELAARLAIERPGMRVLYTSSYSENVITRPGIEGGLPLRC